MPRPSVIQSKPFLRLLPCLVLLISSLFAGDSFAGRDAGQILAQDKANKAVIARRAAAPEKRLASKPDVLPLDHGPRATTTPWSNQQRRMQGRLDTGAAGRSQGS